MTAQKQENKIILDLCGGTGAWSKPYRDAGFTVFTITLPTYDILDTRISDGVLFFHNNDTGQSEYIRAKEVYGIIAAPPCTMFSIARNDKTAKIPRNLREGFRIVQMCLDIVHECLYEPYRKSESNLKFWALENPKGYLERFLGKPALEFDPCEFGDPYTKRTQIWGSFKEPKRKPVEPLRGTMVKHASGFKDLKPVDPEYQKRLKIDSRTIRRSITPSGFAYAFYNANK